MDATGTVFKMTIDGSLLLSSENLSLFVWYGCREDTKKGTEISVDLYKFLLIYVEFQIVFIYFRLL